MSNSGVISGDITAIASAGNATVINWGTITTVNGLQVGADGFASVYNTGTIYGPVTVLAGASVFSAILTNAGVIDGRGYPGNFAIGFGTNSATGAASTLNVLPGSRIFGFIVLAGGIGALGPPTTVNIQSESDISSTLVFGSCGCGGGLTDTGSPVNVFGGAPYVISGNTVAILDPTPFAVQDRNLLDVSNTVLSLATSRLANPAALGGGTASGFAPTGSVAADMARDAFAGISSLNYASQDRVLFNNPSMTAKDGTGIWAQGFGGQRVQDANAPTLRSVNNFYGGALGVDKALSPQVRLGGFVGAGNIKSMIDLNSGNTDSDLAFGGVYGRYALTKSFVDFAVLGGHSSNTTQRLMVNNLAPSGFETAAAKYDGWFVSPEIAYGIQQPAGQNLTMTPVARVRYLAANFGGYQETGSTTNLTVADRTSHQFEERGEFTLTHTTQVTPAEQFQLSGTAGILAIERVGAATVNAVLLGQSLAFATPGNNNVLGFYAGGGFDWHHASGLKVFAAAQFSAMSDQSRTITGKGGVKFSF